MAIGFFTGLIDRSIHRSRRPTQLGFEITRCFLTQVAMPIEQLRKVSGIEPVFSGERHEGREVTDFPAQGVKANNVYIHAPIVHE
jgi:hypothetical protein